MRSLIMRRVAALALITAAVAATAPSLAQPSPQPDPARTLLHLSATGSVQVSPDLLVVDLVAQAVSSSPAAAQRRVNALIADAMKAEPPGTPGGEARATGYSVSPTDDKRTSWTAQQTLELRGTDGPSLLDLAGRLQERGFALADMDWKLSPTARRKAHDQATTAALRELRDRAASAAATLDLHVDHVQEIHLDAGEFLPHRPTPMLAARAMMAPQETASAEEVTASVSADVLLRP